MVVHPPYLARLFRVNHVCQNSNKQTKSADEYLTLPSDQFDIAEEEVVLEEKLDHPRKMKSMDSQNSQSKKCCLCLSESEIWSRADFHFPREWLAKWQSRTNVVLSFWHRRGTDLFFFSPLLLLPSSFSYSPSLDEAFFFGLAIIWLSFLLVLFAFTFGNQLQVNLIAIPLAIW